MRDTHPLLDAILDESTPVAVAVQESRRRMRRTRRHRRTTLAALALIALAAALWPGWHSNKPTYVAGAAEPALPIFSTRETTFPLPIFSSSESHRPFAIFSSRDEPLAIRNIDEHTLFELLNPYGPVIVYVGADKQPTLLLLDPSR